MAEITGGKGNGDYRKVATPPTVPRGHANKRQTVGGSGAFSVARQFDASRSDAVLGLNAEETFHCVASELSRLVVVFPCARRHIFVAEYPKNELTMR